MEALATFRRVFIWLCMHPFEKEASLTTKIIYIIYTIATFTVNFTAVFFASAFIFKYAATDLERSLYALLHIVAHSAIVYIQIAATYWQKKIKTDIFDHLQKIYDAHQNEDHFRYLKEVNEKSEWLWQFFLKVGAGGYFMNNFLMGTIPAIYCWKYDVGFDTKYLYHPFKVLLPWNTKTFIGYIGEIIYGNLLCELFVICTGSVLMLFVALAWHHEAFLFMFRHMSQKVGGNEIEHNQKLTSNLVRFHNEAYKWFLESAVIYSSFVLMQLVCSMISMTCVLFQLDLQLKHADFSTGLLFSCGCVGVNNLIVFCYYGKLTTESFAGMADALYESKWYELPAQLQKQYIIMIGNTQRPVYYHGFGSTVAVLNLETFTNFFKAGLTYYMAFKTMTTK